MSEIPHFVIPEPGEQWPGQGRVRCCHQDWGGSHYHCAVCGDVTGMYGHRFEVRRGAAKWALARAEQIGVDVPFEGFSCRPDLQPPPSLMATCGPWPDGPPWEVSA